MPGFLIVAVCLALACALATPVGAGQDDASPAAPGASILDNGGFERWCELAAAVAAQEGVKSLQLVPPRFAPQGWTPWREAYKDQRPTATIAMDESVKHSGRHSVRIENRDMRDISYLLYSTEQFASRPGDPRNIRPNRRYAVRWWVKGEKVDPAGTGPILMMHVLSMHAGQPRRDDSYELTPLPKGTFDWQSREFRFVTGLEARWVVMTFQLRWTTGTIWYDDVELVDLGPYVQVETY
jgi:hypothetical protein